jgi:hypothetical protein
MDEDSKFGQKDQSSVNAIAESSSVGSSSVDGVTTQIGSSEIGRREPATHAAWLEHSHTNYLHPTVAKKKLPGNIPCRNKTKQFP